MHTESYWNIVDGQGIRKEELKNGIYTCILGRRIDLCTCADSVGSYQADAVTNHGTSRMHRGGSWSLPIVSALAGFCRSGSKRTAVRIRKSSLERCQGGGRSGRVYRHLFGRLQGECSRNQRRANLRISCLFPVQSENEKVRYL